MDESLYRTGSTELRDDELAVLDVLINFGVRFQHLRQESFEFHWNGLSHSLDDDSLRSTLDRFVASGLLMIDANEYYRLTTKGGRVWQCERAPLWDRYAFSLGRDIRAGRQMVSVMAFSPATCDELWSVSCAASMWGNQNSRIRRRRTGRLQDLTPWREYSEAAILVAVSDYQPEEARPFNWELYASERTWWSDVRQLQRFHHN